MNNVTPPRYPGAVWLSTGSANGKMPNGPDAGSLHEAVTRARSVFGWVQTAKSCHAYNSQNGYFEQYAEWDDWMYGCSDGNSHVITIESFDGLLIHSNPYREEGMGGIYGTSADTGRWDDGQLERIADVIAFLNVAVGISMDLSTTAGHPGWNGHRIGIDQWRTDHYNAGEVWTQHNGKPCPGDLRMAQIPGILARAAVIKAAVQAGTATWLPTGEVDLASALARGGATPTPPAPTPDLLEWIVTLPGAPDGLTYQQLLADITHTILTQPLAVGGTTATTTLARAVPNILKTVQADAGIDQATSNAVKKLAK